MTDPEMSQQAREILKRYRSAESLGSEARARMLTGLRAKIATGTPPLGATKASLLSKLATAGKTKIILGALAVAVPAAWTIHRSQSSVDYTLRTATPSVPAAPAVAAQPESTPAPRALGDEPYGSAQASDVAPAATAGEADVPANEETSVAKRSVGAQRPQSVTANKGITSKAVVLEETAEESPAEAPPTSTLDREMQLLKRAQVAQAAGRPSEALSILGEHASQFPNGKLAESREVARVIALCQAGQAQASRSAAERFLAARPNSPFASRVRGVCAGK